MDLDKNIPAQKLVKEYVEIMPHDRQYRTTGIRVIPSGGILISVMPISVQSLIF